MFRERPKYKLLVCLQYNLTTYQRCRSGPLDSGEGKVLGERPDSGRREQVL